MKSLVLSPDLQPVLARFWGGHADLDEQRVAPADGVPLLWRELVEDVGVLGLLVEEEHGGQGAGVPELAAAVLEAGRVGWAGPLASVAGVTVRLLARVDPADASGLRRRIAEDGLRVAVAALETSDAADLETCATVSDASGRIAGTKLFVDGAAFAEQLLVVSQGPDGPAVHLVAPDAPGVTVRPVDAVDPARGLAEVVLDGAQGVSVVEEGTGPDRVREALAESWMLGAVLTAADVVGLAARVLDLSVGYARTRTQFGRTIASFQAVKHVLVDMYAELETANSAVEAAVADLAVEAERRHFSASAAKARACDAAMVVVRQGVQVHGGIGFTWEHEVSHHFRRATAARQLYGTPTAHRSRIADLEGI
ncbi:acyl-CoA dehydrogenase family protein [Nocardioides campestrisoli]|uniref:acyl-CoA dehydrogenase family protein n=1 Tax=Nocardioides campestrisoli TaxID=2736757 RepID=UPI00163DDC00|nr:acyl-CoA dehydrogenase family protein [Nocardioides campestrisoli]